MEHQIKDIFQIMKRHDSEGTPFDEGTIRNWYRARRYVLDRFTGWTGSRFGPGSGDSFRIAIDGQGPLVYAVVRHIALMAHFPNFDEGSRKRVSVITIIYPEGTGMEYLENEIEALAKEEYLFNLIRYSRYTLVDALGNSKSSDRWLPFLDIEFVLTAKDRFAPGVDEIIISENDIMNAVGTLNIMSMNDDELTAAMLVNQAYSTGAEITNLSSTENDKASRYGMALNCLNSTKRKKAKEEWKSCFKKNASGAYNLSHKQISGILSSIFCADTFESRLHQLMKIPNGITHKFLVLNANNIRRKIAGNLLALSKSEHARWNAEKLLLGFRPFTAEESYRDEVSIGSRNAFRKRMKDNFPSPAHVDIVSNADLKRINPEDVKYDSFIMLAIPTILMRKYSPGNRISRLFFLLT